MGVVGFGGWHFVGPACGGLESRSSSASAITPIYLSALAICRMHTLLKPCRYGIYLPMGLNMVVGPGCDVMGEKNSYLPLPAHTASMCHGRQSTAHVLQRRLCDGKKPYCSNRCRKGSKDPSTPSLKRFSRSCCKTQAIGLHYIHSPGSSSFSASLSPSFFCVTKPVACGYLPNVAFG